MAEKEAVALKLAQAQRDLEAQLEQAVSGYEKHIHGPLSFELNFGGGVGGWEDVDGEKRKLVDTVRALVDTFQRSDVVQETGVWVFKVTAIDSNADGKPAVDVKYEYRYHPGMGRNETLPTS